MRLGWHLARWNTARFATLVASCAYKIAEPLDPKLSVLRDQTIPFVVPFAEIDGVGLYVPALSTDFDVGVVDVMVPLANANAFRRRCVPRCKHCRSNTPARPTILQYFPLSGIGGVVCVVASQIFAIQYVYSARTYRSAPTGVAASTDRIRQQHDSAGCLVLSAPFKED